MAKTTSIRFPEMIDVARNRVSVATDNVSVVNRTRLLLLTEPSELYNNPSFGVGLKRYLWQYNTENTVAIIRDRIVEQLRTYEPCVDPDSTAFADSLLFTGGQDGLDHTDRINQLKLTVGLHTVFGDEVEVPLNE